MALLHGKAFSYSTFSVQNPSVMCADSQSHHAIQRVLMGFSAIVLL